MGLIRKLFRKLRGKKSSSPSYTYQPDHVVVADFCEFSGMTPALVEQAINDYEKLCQQDWAVTPGEGFSEKSIKFYGASRNYVFDLLLGNAKKEMVIEKLDSFCPQLLSSIREHPGKDFLEFGGGTGVFCEIVHGMGKDVTCLDIEGVPQQFASWRFTKYKLPIRIARTSPDRVELDRDYDIIFTDAVLEHLPPERQLAAVETLCSRLKPQGLLILLVDLAGESEENPTHTDVDIRKLHDVPRRHQFRCEFGENTFCSIWRKQIG